MDYRTVSQHAEWNSSKCFRERFMSTGLWLILPGLALLSYPVVIILLVIIFFVQWVRGGSRFAYELGYYMYNKAHLSSLTQLH